MTLRAKRIVCLLRDFRVSVVNFLSCRPYDIRNDKCRVGTWPIASRGQFQSDWKCLTLRQRTPKGGQRWPNRPIGMD